jgi:hypothetical protein
MRALILSTINHNFFFLAMMSYYYYYYYLFFVLKPFVCTLKNILLVFQRAAYWIKQKKQRSFLIRILFDPVDLFLEEDN